MIDMEEHALKEAMTMIPMKRMGQADEVWACQLFNVGYRGLRHPPVISINGGCYDTPVVITGMGG